MTQPTGMTQPGLTQLTQPGLTQPSSQPRSQPSSQPADRNGRVAPAVAIVMGSDSDWPVMSAAAEALAEFGIVYTAEVLSAHRMPADMLTFGEQAAERGFQVIIAGAGGAAHLPGMLAAVTSLPVIGVPVPLKYLDGMDSLLSIVKMPAGVPVATVGIGQARNAGLLAVRMLGTADPTLRTRMDSFRSQLRAVAIAKGESLREQGHGAGAAPGWVASDQLA